MPLMQPWCARCKGHHRPDLPCWKGRHATERSRACLEQLGRVCWICGELADTADHVVARSKGGGDELGNLRPACRSCNSRRGNDDNPFDPDPPIAPTGVALTESWQP